MTEQESRLRAVESKLDRLLVVVGELAKRFDDHAEDQQRFREKTNAVLYGDGNGKRGVMVRLDRVEQGQARAARLMWLVLGGVMAALLSQILR